MKVNVNNTDSNPKLSPEILSSTFSLALLTIILVLIHICFGHLFFHAIAELFSVFVGVLMLVVIANTSTFIKNSFLLYLSISYFWLAILDVFHTFTFPGMILSDGTHGQLTLQFWVYARFIESLVLLVSPIFLKKYINGKLYFSIGCIVCCIVVWVSLNFKNPQMITEKGLTPFKIYSEYLIIFILLMALLNFLRLRKSFNPSVFWYIFSSLCLTIASEYFLTLYEDVYHVSVIIGHILKFLSFSLIYQAVVRTTLRSPFESLAQVSNSHDAIPHPSIIVSKKGKISQVNNSALQLINKPNHIINNDHIHQHFHPNTFIESQCSFCQSIITGTTLSQETVYFPQYDKWYLLSLTPLKLLDKIEGMVQTLTDISDLIASNDKLEKETKEKTSAITKTQNLQKYLSSIFDSIPSILLTVDNKCLITQWNLKAQETINLDFKSVQHKPLDQVFPFLKEDIDTIVNCINKKQSKIINNRQLTKSDDIQYFDIIIFPLVVDTMAGSLIIIDDVSTQFKLKEQFDMAKKMETIGQLSSGIAHDFNNMLGAILGAAELLALKDNTTASDRSIYLDIIINTVQKATGLTSKLLSFSRKKQLQKTVIDFHEVIDDTLLITQRTTDRIVNFCSKLNATHSVVIGDFSALQNVLLNLILNASYAIKGDGEILIKTKNIYLDQRYCDESTFDITPGNYLELLIKDSGEGISPENISKVFEPFFTTKPQGEGTGLGLSSAYGTIFEHHGIIQVDSKLEVGTEFKILLACTQGTPSIKPETHTLQTFSGLVLLVDDEEIIRMTVTSMLENMGFKVINASNGKEAIEIYKKQSHEIDLCIVDMIMPKLNGKDTFYQLKDINADCQVILSSGYIKDDNLKTLMNDGLNGLISKPYRYSDLNKVISDIQMT